MVEKQPMEKGILRIKVRPSDKKSAIETLYGLTQDYPSLFKGVYESLSSVSYHELWVELEGYRVDIMGGTTLVIDKFRKNKVTPSVTCELHILQKIENL